MHNTVFITGGNRGIGLELCKKFAFDYNFKVYMGSRDLNKAKEVINSLGSPNNIIPIEIDVEFEDSISNAYKEYLKLKDKDEKLYIFINNAAAQLDWIPAKEHIKTLEIPIDLLDRIYRINVFASILTTRYFSESMENTGRILNIGSGAGELYNINANKDMQIGYASSKLALMMVTKKLSAAVKDKNIYVNCVNPGWCKTSMGGNKAPSTAEDGANNIIKACFLDNENPPNGKYIKFGKVVNIDKENNSMELEVKKLKLEENINIIKGNVYKLASFIPIKSIKDKFINKILNIDNI